MNGTGNVGRYPVLAMLLLSPALMFFLAGLAGGDLHAGERQRRTLSFEELELADSGEEIARGMMHRRRLCDECGMIFYFRKERPLSFWMKNTYLSLDMIFLDSSGRIVNIHRDTVPLRESPSYPSLSQARFVIEAGAGYAKRHSLEIGQRIDLPHLLEQSVDYRWSESQEVDGNVVHGKE